MNVTGLAVALGCLVVGSALIVGAVTQMRTGETPSGGTGGPLGPIRRDAHPRYFTCVLWVRLILGPLAAAGGVAGLIHLL